MKRDPTTRRGAGRRRFHGQLQLTRLPATPDGSAAPFACTLIDQSERLRDLHALETSAETLRQREAFLLQAEAGMSLAEIAQATGVSQETAKSRLRYARARLRETLEAHA